ncbi:hypothetical protein B5M42_015180 [Paenibacillus athensensis]|uniref:Uncharacterized protein n=1 Tax=Paenibacillus athensensis TaxID=1967502 RepID=A0A4Y8Q9P1_9BACL|nr:hypothetical protein [Paenibacillus athensensis]MCD1260156.1 hypothetical protein [Paenibacillus athensensis]
MLSLFQKQKNAPELQQQPVSAAGSDTAAQPEAPVAAATAEDGPGAFGSKAHLDKKSLDLVFAVEQMIQAKQHVELSHQDLQERLGHANGQIERLSRDLRTHHKVIEEREAAIRELEQRMSDKNLKIDQMMEDYRELQAALSGEIEELKSAMELERQNYASLLSKHNETLVEKNKRIGELDEKNGKLETELAHLKLKYETIRQEKTHLMNMVNDFTSRMTAPFVAQTGD